MNEQPEALRLAEMIERYNAGVHSQAIVEDYSRAAAELRRQNREIEKLYEYADFAEARITTLEAALRQAVEAFELYQSKMSVEKFDAAIAAAKQALGEA